ncbi:MAG: tetratricopeptide repeat protein, partial [Desulfobacterales bacterium]|nr:tetratricopeptide repeat protein [Desulfobacterales bacterium]
PLPPMDEYEGKKQASARERSFSEKKKISADPRRTERCIKMARGNPGLQDLLFSMSLQAPDRCDTALGEMEAYIESGRAAGEENLRGFLENLAVEGLIDLLTPTEKDLLKASTLFRIPAPVETLRLLGMGGGDRLFALGLWDAYEDLVNSDVTAAAVNPMARPKSGELSEEERQTLAQTLLKDLFVRWGGGDEKNRPFVVNLELTRVGLLGNDADVLAAAAEDAISGLESRFLYRRAAEMAVDSIGVLEDSSVQVPTWLYLRANEVCHSVGEIEKARSYVENAIKLLRVKKTVDGRSSDFDLGSTLLRHGRLLIQSGEPIEALKAFEEAKILFKTSNHLKDQAIATGDIARIRVDKGEVDEALSLHQEMLRVFEELGDRRSRAVTLGDIARIRVSKGEVDEALSLHQEELKVYEELGDRRSRAVTLGDIARIRVSKGEVEKA